MREIRMNQWKLLGKGTSFLRGLALAVAASFLVASGASAATILVTYELLYQDIGPTATATGLTRQEVTNTPLGAGNMVRMIGNPRTGQYAAVQGNGSTATFSASTVTLEFQGDEFGNIVDGAVTLVDVLINQQFSNNAAPSALVPAVHTDIVITGGGAVGVLSGSTITWNTDALFTTEGGVFCAQAGFIGCSTGGLAIGWNPKDGTDPQTLGDFNFSGGVNDPGAEFASVYYVSDPNADVYTHWVAAEVSRVVVPEPGSAALMLLGVAGLVARRMRRI